MKRLRVAVNGCGRIGRQTIVMLVEDYSEYFDVVAVNDLASIEDIQRRLERDSVYGKFPGFVDCLEGKDRPTLSIKNSSCSHVHYVSVCSESEPAQLPWKELEVNIVIDATGRFTTREQLNAHFIAGAKRVVLTAPTKDESIPMYVNGVNTDGDDFEKQNIISNASCTTNCVAPVLFLLQELFGVDKAYLNTVHAVTNGQKLFDGMGGKDPRRDRACMSSIIPASTGAAVALEKILPKLKGRLGGEATRVPLVTGSYVDLEVVLNEDISVEELKTIFLESVCGYGLEGVVELIDDPQFVSIDVSGMTAPSVVSLDLIKRTWEKTFRIKIWYDNELSYVYQLCELIFLHNVEH